MARKPDPPSKPKQPKPQLRLDGADPYRHQELQFEYYEPAHMAKVTMSPGPGSMVAACIFGALAVVASISYPILGLTWLAGVAFVFWCNRTRLTQ